MTCFFFSTAADWADTFSAAAVWAALAAEVAPAAVAARAVQPVAAAAAAAQRAEAAQAVQPAEASAAAGRPWGVVEVARPAPEAVVAARASTRVAAAGSAAMASLRPVSEALACPAPARSAAWSDFGRPAACRARQVLPFCSGNSAGRAGGGSLGWRCAPGVGGGGGAPLAPGTGSALLRQFLRNGAAPGLTLAGVTPGAGRIDRGARRRRQLALLDQRGALRGRVRQSRPERGTASTGRAMAAGDGAGLLITVLMTVVLWMLLKMMLPGGART